MRVAVPCRDAEESVTSACELLCIYTTARGAGSPRIVSPRQAKATPRTAHRALLAERIVSIRARDDAFARYGRTHLLLVHSVRFVPRVVPFQRFRCKNLRNPCNPPPVSPRRRTWAPNFVGRSINAKKTRAPFSPCKSPAPPSCESTYRNMPRFNGFDCGLMLRVPSG